MGEATPQPLWEAERHTRPTDTPWSQGAARAAIERITTDVRDAFHPQTWWPFHPNDGEAAPTPLGCMYFGAAGVVWALNYLTRAGACAPGPAFAEGLGGLMKSNRAMMRQSHPGVGGLLMGDSGMLLPQWRAKPEPALLDAIAEAIATTAHDPALEFMWGSPGGIVVALGLYEETGEARWLDLVRTCADDLEATLVMDDDRAFAIWTQSLYGGRRAFLGAVHGFAGNAYALIRAREHLPAEQWARLAPKLAQTFAATALRQGALANWAPSLEPGVPFPPKLLVQHCHGASGMVVCLAGLDQPIDDLLIAAGECVWAAGPLAKGANLCHGSGGNGYAFLKLFERTGDQLWLDRARAFAMHAIEQSDADAVEFGQRRYSLWTGDPGLACYLWDCIEAKARFPTMDVV